MIFFNSFLGLVFAGLIFLSPMGQATDINCLLMLDDPRELNHFPSLNAPSDAIQVVNKFFTDASQSNSPDSFSQTVSTKSDFTEIQMIVDGDVKLAMKEGYAEEESLRESNSEGILSVKFGKESLLATQGRMEFWNFVEIQAFRLGALSMVHAPYLSDTLMINGKKQSNTNVSAGENFPALENVMFWIGTDVDPAESKPVRQLEIVSKFTNTDSGHQYTIRYAFHKNAVGAINLATMKIIDSYKTEDFAGYIGRRDVIHRGVLYRHQ